MHVLTIRLSGSEKEILEEAAGRAGLALGAYIGQAGLDAAEYRVVPVPVFQREMLAELMRTAGLIRRIGVNLNQAVAKLNATGAAGPDLGPSAAYCARVARHVDEVALVVRRRMA